MDGNKMLPEELVIALRRMAAETGSLPCLGCGHEHSCGAHGCAILKAAANVIEAAVRDLTRLGDCEVCAYMKPCGVDTLPCLDCKTGESFVWRGMERSESRKTLPD